VQYFDGDDGSDLLGLSEAQMIDRMSELGVNEARKWAQRLYNVLHPKKL